ncbi:helix-turn-helix transcriptional regulator [Streptomyces sp. YIM 121038]|uniref:helix-turn-helix domain-containing protein n=1 Tax=Streptomyces sp. YIM 121038 TaxID=2136401 RepID=UPI0014864624|nr:helix-turn-helix transcriptional regulator [Streptomyces sp. YIM 121038]
MGRPERPVATANACLEELAQWLRAQRHAAGLTHRELAGRSAHAFSDTTFSRATTGTRIPRLPVVEAYARACGASVTHARRLWRAARYAEHRHRNPGARVPRPDRVYNKGELIHALQQLYYKAGAMPMDEMEHRAGDHGELPHSTVRRMLAGTSMFDLQQLYAFLHVCDVTGSAWEQWCQAWKRAKRRCEVLHAADRALRTRADGHPGPRDRARPAGAPRRSAGAPRAFPPVALAMPLFRSAPVPAAARPSPRPFAGST